MTTETKNTKIALIINTNKTHTAQAGMELRKWLARRVTLIADDLNCDIDLAKNLPPVDFVIILGGDGTILKAVRALGDRQIPIIGVNMGKLGFMAEFSLNQLKEHFERIITDKSLISKRTMLKCQVQGPAHSEKDNTVTAVNEIAVIAGPPFRMIEVSLSIGQEPLALCTGDGIIVSTPTGSTAYNLSAGGPILSATMEAAVITPLAAHSLSFRPIVVDMDVPIVLQVQDISSKNAQYDAGNRNKHSGNMDDYSENQLNFSKGGAIAVIDGQKSIVITRQDKLIITRANRRFKLLRNPTQSQWKLLNTKLNWGALPNYTHRI